MEIPNSQACMLPLLKFAADGHQHSLQEATDALAEHFQLPPEKRMQLRESGVNILYNTVGWARTFLKQAELLEYPERGMLQITEEGKKVLESNVQHIDFKYLERFPAFVEFQNRKKADAQMETSSDTLGYTKSGSELNQIGMNNPNTIKETIQKILDLQPKWNKSPTPEMNERGILVRNTLPQLLENLLKNLPISIPDIGFQGRDGTGNKNRVPWVRIFSRIHSPKATDGWDVGLLFASDGSAAYLSLGMGSTEDKTFQPKNPEEIARKIRWARDVHKNRNTNIEGLLEPIQLKDPGLLGRSYENSNIYNIKYRSEAVPEDEQIIKDVSRFLCMLSDLYQAEESLVPISTQQALESPKEDRQIWVFAPGPQARFWNDCRTGSIAVFGTDLLGPLDAYSSKDEIQQRLKVVYPKDTDTEPSNDALAAWEFSRVMKEGDLVIAKKGSHKIVGVGVVSGPYRHDPSRSVRRQGMPSL